MIITGLTAAFVVNYLLAQSAGDSLGELGGREAWRWMYLAQAVPAAVFLVALLFIPESPRYLVSRKREQEALAVLTRLFGAEEAERKVVEIRKTFSDDHRPRLRDVTAPGTGFRPIGTLNVQLMGDAPLSGKYTLISGFTSVVDNGLLLGTLPDGADYALTVDPACSEVYLTATTQMMIVPEPGTTAALLMASSLLLGSRRVRRRCAA